VTLLKHKSSFEAIFFSVKLEFPFNAFVTRLQCHSGCYDHMF